MRKLSFIIATSVAWASTAGAADAPEPTVVDSPMSSSSPTGAAAGSRPSDLPAPDTTSLVNRPLLLTSTLVLAAAYVPVVAVAYTSDRQADQKNLYYPIVGPWMNLADRQCDVRPCNNEGVNKTLLILDGVGQGVGAIGVVASFFLPGKTTRHWYLVGNERVHAGPSPVGTYGYGVGAAGQF